MSEPSVIAEFRRYSAYLIKSEILSNCHTQSKIKCLGSFIFKIYTCIETYFINKVPRTNSGVTNVIVDKLRSGLNQLNRLSWNHKYAALNKTSVFSSGATL